MARFARINPDLSVMEWRDLEPGTEIPAHKKLSDTGLLLRPVVEDAIPDYRPELAQLTSQTVVEPAQVRIVRQVVPLPRAAQLLAVKTEARRRILLRYPDWKQTNMTARGVELQDIRRRNGAWTAEEQAEADALSGVWTWIKTVREASNEIEALDPIPNDYDANARWPA